MKACRHCGHILANYPRGLCKSCYRKPAVRDRYPSETDPYDDFGFVGTPAPTRTLPGTERKMARLARRAALRQALFHQRDAQRD